jgi:hypothetical protein
VQARHLALFEQRQRPRNIGGLVAHIAAQSETYPHTITL